MKSKIQKYLKHKFPLMNDAYADNIATELETELSQKEKTPSVEEYAKLMDEEATGSVGSVDLKIG